MPGGGNSDWPLADEATREHPWQSILSTRDSGPSRRSTSSRKRFGKFDSQGYSIDHEEFTRGLQCLAGFRWKVWEAGR